MTTQRQESVCLWGDGDWGMRSSQYTQVPSPPCAHGSAAGLQLAQHEGQEDAEQPQSDKAPLCGVSVGLELLQQGEQLSGLSRRPRGHALRGRRHAHQVSHAHLRPRPLMSLEATPRSYPLRPRPRKQPLLSHAHKHHCCGHTPSQSAPRPPRKATPQTQPLRPRPQCRIGHAPL